jgi:hypothetical protein
LQLLKSLSLPHFPSGSSINYFDHRFFLVGDDASNILVLDDEYHEVGSSQLYNSVVKRIPKHEKADLEASTFLNLNGIPHLLILGSASTHARKKILLIPFEKSGLDLSHASDISDEIFTDRLRTQGIAEVNFEGITSIGENLIIGNRGNRKNVTNHLIITKSTFWKDQTEVNLKIIPVYPPSSTTNNPGLSELYYEPSLDLLLITLSSEETDSAYDDGVIGDSYIGWIRNFSTQTDADALTIERMINLSDVDPEFKHEKIEGLCVEGIQDSSLIIHLVSDNDQGASKLFKIKMPREILREQF